MTGLNHDFLVIKTNSFSLGKYDTYSKTDIVEIHDSLLNYFADSISWISSYNPCIEEETNGLCWYGPTIINAKNIHNFKQIISGWFQIFSIAPQSINLSGNWSWMHGELSETGKYEKLLFSKSELLDKLSKLISFCDEIMDSKGTKSLLHLGI